MHEHDDILHMMMCVADADVANEFEYHVSG